MQETTETPSRNSNGLLGTALLMLCLFFPYAWYFIPYDLVWTFLFFDASTQEFSLNPVETRSYPIQTIAPFYFSFVAIPIYIYARGLIPVMTVWGINVWAFHFGYTSILAADLFLSFSHTPYIRTVAIVLGVCLHSLWVINNYVEK